MKTPWTASSIAKPEVSSAGLGTAPAVEVATTHASVPPFAKSSATASETKLAAEGAPNVAV